MDQKKKINLLVISDLFPSERNFFSGIFIVDYLKSVKQYCNIDVLNIRLVGEKGLKLFNKEFFHLYQYSLLSKPVVRFVKPIVYFFWFVKILTFQKKFKKIEIIHAHGTILSGTVAWLYSVLLNKPFVITEHLGPFTVISNNPIKLKWAKFIMQKANLLLVVSNHLKQEILSSKIHPQRIEISYNPVDTDIFLLKKTDKINKQFLFVGRLDSFKGAFRVLKAFRSLTNSYPDWKYLIIGMGEDWQHIKHFIEENPELQNRVKLFGWKSKQEIAEIMLQCDFFIFPSLHESFGLVIAEAMASGLPVITTKYTAPPEYVDEKCGWTIDPESIDEITGALDYFINNHQNYNSFYIRNHIVNFSIQRFGHRLYKYYTSVLCAE